ncbi:MAG: hypothetical protein ACP5GU_09000 [Thermoprotei archaeon]
MKYKSIVLLILVIILSYVLPLITNDWRFVIVVGVISGLFLSQKRKSFIVSFIGTLISWTMSTLYIVSLDQNQKLLSLISQIAGMSSIILIVIFIFIPALVAGFSSLAATLIRDLVSR